MMFVADSFEPAQALVPHQCAVRAVDVLHFGLQQMVGDDVKFLFLIRAILRDVFFPERAQVLGILDGIRESQGGRAGIFADGPGKFPRLQRAFRVRQRIPATDHARQVIDAVLFQLREYLPQTFGGPLSVDAEDADLVIRE